MMAEDATYVYAPRRGAMFVAHGVIQGISAP